jgi:hypothetical protein
VMTSPLSSATAGKPCAACLGLLEPAHDAPSGGRSTRPTPSAARCSRRSAAPPADGYGEGALRSHWESTQAVELVGGRGELAPLVAAQSVPPERPVNLRLVLEGFHLGGSRRRLLACGPAASSRFWAFSAQRPARCGG